MVDQQAEIDQRIRNYEGDELIGYESSDGSWYGVSNSATPKPVFDPNYVPPTPGYQPSTGAGE